MDVSEVRTASTLQVQITVVLEASRPSEKSVNFHQNVWCHIQENRHFNGHRIQNIIPLLLSVAYAIRNITLYGISLAVANTENAVTVLR
jgi:hypothetical protein